MVITPRLVISAPASGCGKTTVATGLMAALRARGVAVSGHKAGPDYIDPGYHALATGRPGRNLDPFLCGEELIAPLFAHGAAGADIAVIEGAMGLFDGLADPAAAGAAAGPDFASTAHVARLLRAPVMLVVDAAAVGRSVAAVVAGFAGFDPRVRVAGVILNRVGSERHERLLRDAVESLSVPVFGAIRRTDAAVTPSRHLGLVPAAERRTAAERAIAGLADLVASSCDLHRLQALASTAPPLATRPWDPHAALRAAAASGSPGSGHSQVSGPGSPPGGGSLSGGGSPADRGPVPGAGSPSDRASLSTPTMAHCWGDSPSNGPSLGLSHRGSRAAPSARSSANRPEHTLAWAEGGAKPLVAVAQGPAFTFSYTEHAELLEAAGARIAPFDPLIDEALPDRTAGFVIGGGFPEMYAPELSGNAPLRQQVGALAAAGAPVVAECAGLLYLARSLDGLPMCGVVDADTHMTDRLTLGYRTAEAVSDSALARAGDYVRGHEFHRTAAEPGCGRRPAWRLATGRAAEGTRAGATRDEGHVHGNVIASYLHLHWAAAPSFALRFVAACSPAAGGASRPAAGGGAT